MATFDLEEAVQAEKAADELDLSGVPAHGTPVERWRAELGAYFAEMQKFENMEPNEVFLRLSAFTARASEIRFQITQTESRRGQSFRTQAIDPFLDECDRQFRVHSRVAAMREFEWKVTGGPHA